MLKGLAIKELPDIDDKYTVDERAYFNELIVKNEGSSDERFNTYKADLEVLRVYAQSHEKATRERAALQQPATTGFFQNSIARAGNLLRAFQSGRTSIAQAIFEHNTPMAVSLIESSNFNEYTQVFKGHENEILWVPHRKPLDLKTPLDYPHQISLIHYAIFHGEIEVVRALIKKNPHLKDVKFNGMSPLNYAILCSYHYGYDRQGIALALIDMGVDLESQSYRHSPLFLAKGLRSIALALLRKKVKLNNEDFNEHIMEFLLHEQCETVFVALFNMGVPIDCLFNKIPNRQSLVNFTQFFKYRDLIKELIDTGVISDDKAPFMFGPLVLAIKNGQDAIARIILAKTKQIPDDYSNFILHWTIRHGRRSIAQLLFKKTNINGNWAQTAEQSYHTHLGAAIHYCQTAIALDLIAEGAILEGNLERYLHAAISSGLSKIVQVMLEKGAKPMLPVVGKTAVNAAIAIYHEECQKLPASQDKIRERANVVVALCKHFYMAGRPVLFDNKPILHHYIYEVGYAEIALSLISNNAVDIEVIDDDMTPLHYAIRRNRPAVALALINKGAKLDVLFKEMTPLHHAIRENNTDVALALIAKDPDIINHTKYRGKTVLEHALAVQELDYQYKLKINSSEICRDNPIVTELKRRLPSSNAMEVDATTIDSDVRASRKMRIG